MWNNDLHFRSKFLRDQETTAPNVPKEVHGFAQLLLANIAQYGNLKRLLIATTLFPTPYKQTMPSLDKFKPRLPKRRLYLLMNHAEFEEKPFQVRTTLRSDPRAASIFRLSACQS
jgi:hypothetical protein